VLYIACIVFAIHCLDKLVLMYYPCMELLETYIIGKAQTVNSVYNVFLLEVCSILVLQTSRAGGGNNWFSVLCEAGKIVTGVTTGERIAD